MRCTLETKHKGSWLKTFPFVTHGCCPGKCSCCNDPKENGKLLHFPTYSSKNANMKVLAIRETKKTNWEGGGGGGVEHQIIIIVILLLLNKKKGLKD